MALPKKPRNRIAIKTTTMTTKILSTQEIMQE
jgi:hypothetical protein